jgi:hypothetical protein
MGIATDISAFLSSSIIRAAGAATTFSMPAKE